ncbi:MAG: M28 family peptidase [Gemmatimonadales bacterium]|nr:M28 family peptidase [Gemmatimonadales bacterium]
MSGVFRIMPALVLLTAAAVPARAQDAATVRRMRGDAEWLSADAREGRLTGTAGMRAAADWVARRFRESGLAPGVGKEWFHDFPIAKDAPGIQGSGLDSLPGLQGRNVIGFLRGKDARLRDEVVVIGAHYDHLGRGVVGSLDGRGEIHNGADDNASGTVTLVEIARLLAKKPPRRSVIFIAFSGEEEGLLGSTAYVRAPVVPMDRTLAMLNLDMVGRMRENRIMALGVETAVELRALLDSANRIANLDIAASGDGYGASDHQSFYLAKRPVLHFFTGSHEDYHRAGDDAAKLDVAGMGRIAQLTADLARVLADRTAPLTFVDRPPPAPVAGGGRGYGAWFGSIPDMTGGGPGVRFSGVSPGSPAEKAGLRADDVLLRLGAFDIKDLQAMTDALRTMKPGDTVATVIRRGTKVDTIQVVLGRRGG